MTLPLYQTGSFDYATGMALAVVLGFFFGFALERGGFSRATILAAQFYGRNNRVFKVMFTAIVTATVGLGVLSGFGIVDVNLVEVPATNYIPLAAGGFLLGVGFIISGYCPGTAVVGMASGSKDAAISLIGMAIGSIAFAMSWGWIENFYNGFDRGSLRLTEIFNLSWPIVAFGVLLLALGGFWGAEALERVLAKKDKLPVPDADPRPKRLVFGFISAAAALGLLTLVIPTQAAKTTPFKVTEVEAISATQALISQPRNFWVVDLRSEAECGEARLPSALCIPSSDNEAAFIKELPPERTLLVYGSGKDLTLPASVKGYLGEVQVLKGGFESYHSKLLREPQAPTGSNQEEFLNYRMRLELHNHLLGGAQKAPVKRVIPKAVTRAPRKGGGC